MWFTHTRTENGDYVAKKVLSLSSAGLETTIFRRANVDWCVGNFLMRDSKAGRWRSLAAISQGHFGWHGLARVSVYAYDA